MKLARSLAPALTVALLFTSLAAPALRAQEEGNGEGGDKPAADRPDEGGGKKSAGEERPDRSRGRIDVEEAAQEAVRRLLDMQEGEPQAEWPYEGVYRVAGEIPIGYRVGGTSIACLALLSAPGYAEDAPRREAVARALAFVQACREHPLMSPEYDGGYDVRGWGYTYALQFLLRLEAAEAAPEGQGAAVKAGAQWYLDAITRTEIPKTGGWSYSRPRGNRPSPACPFMTAPTLLALYQARAQGYTVDAAMVARALEYLEKSRTETGAVNYAGTAEREQDPVPGAVGRMLAAETALVLAGRSSLVNLRAALDAFIVHWKHLEDRRAKTGTHVGPYAVAPYYFYYAHQAAAQAVELLPRQDKREYRRRVLELLFGTRREDGTWNDRVFPRTANYGTSMAILSVFAPKLPPLARWKE